MQKSHFIVIIFVGLILTCAGSLTSSRAQEAQYNIAYADVFGKLRRPQVKFSHKKHSETLAEAGCGVCHHNPDEETGKLVYIEGEELSCRECHAAQQEDHEPALREAFHGNCTGCHRDIIRAGKRDSGPTTCGGCHKKD